jgi:hypothetical protein
MLQQLLRKASISINFYEVVPACGGTGITSSGSTLFLCPMIDLESADARDFPCEGDQKDISSQAFSMDESEHQETRGRLIRLAGDPMSSNAKKRMEERIDKSMWMWIGGLA